MVGVVRDPDRNGPVMRVTSQTAPMRNRERDSVVTSSPPARRTIRWCGAIARAATATAMFSRPSDETGLTFEDCVLPLSTALWKNV